MTIEFTVTIEEWNAASSLFQMSDDDETERFGFMHVRSSNGIRRWTCFGGARAAFLDSTSTTVDFDIEFVGGVKSALFGGEGLFFASMTGPGRVWLQTLPFSRLADRIHSAFRGDREDVKRDFGGLLGGLGNLIGGDR